MFFRITDTPVDWIYDFWDELANKLKNENSFQRSIGIMVLCNLAKSDIENRFEKLLGNVLAHTNDEKFITSRQTIQSLWKVAIAKPKLYKKIINHLEKQFISCHGQKHHNLIRQDVILSLKYIYKSMKDKAIYTKVLSLIENENDEKYKKKYKQVIGSE